MSFYVHGWDIHADGLVRVVPELRERAPASAPPRTRPTSRRQELRRGAAAVDGRWRSHHDNDDCHLAGGDS